MEWVDHLQRSIGGAKKFDGIPDADIILITDIHGDHLNVETLKSINTTTATFVVPQAVADKMPSDLKSQSADHWKWRK